jgi:predicted nucleic acid-binding protein
MPDMICNSSCLIALDNIGKLTILRDMYGAIFITEEVAAEFGKRLENWITIRHVQDRNVLRSLHNIVDLGEASTIALAFEFKDCVLILDDLRARKVANNLGLRYTGLLGILPKAKQRGLISSVSETLKQLRLVKFRISQDMENNVLTLAGEI